MKTAKKALLLISCAVLLVVASVVGTMAYLTSKDTVTNTFTVGKVKIELDEANVDENGNMKDLTRVKANSYKLVPGHEYIKDPTVTIVHGSEDSYVRAIVTVERIDKLKKVFSDSSYYDSKTRVFLLEKLIEGWNKNLWEFNTYTEEGNNGVYEFRYRDVCKSHPTSDLKLTPIFTKIKVPGEDVTSENIESLSKVKIVVEAHAIQADGFGSAGKAWLAFK